MPSHSGIITRSREVKTPQGQIQASNNSIFQTQKSVSQLLETKGGPGNLEPVGSWQKGNDVLFGGLLMRSKQ